MMQKLLSLLVCLLFASAACADDFIVAVRAHHGIDASKQQWTATVDALNAAIPEHRFTLQPIVSLDDITTMAGKGEFDFLITNPSSFVEIQQRYDAVALATLNNRRSDTAQTRFGSVIFTHVSRADILDIQDLEGKSLMAVSEPAFGGWRVAWLEMKKAGFDPYSQLAELRFSESKTQPEVVYAVRDEKVDVGVVRTDLLERMEREGKIDLRYFRIINNRATPGFPFFHSSRLYPEWAFVALRHAPADMISKVNKVLFSIKEEDTAAQHGKYVGWVSALDYGSVRELMQVLAVGPYTAKSEPMNTHLGKMTWFILVVSVLLAVILLYRARRP